jgi:ATP-dependent DNA helicase RecQ
VSDADLQAILENDFNLSSFRLGQKEIIGSVLAGKDVLAVLPTGGGKSLCYQIPALSKRQLVIVVSPLIALMKDQVSGLRRRKIPAGCLHSGQSDEEKREVFREMEKKGPFLLYLSPERAQKEGFRNWLKNRAIALFAVDEAHCVSQWGHDYREEYSQLKVLKELRPDVPVLALTASATPLVLADISKNLNLKSPARHVHGFYRPNLYYQVEPCSDDEFKYRQLLQAVEQNPVGRILVYCGTRKGTEEVAVFLQRNFAAVACYHAGLSSQERARIQTDYETSKTRILVATNAFGMGIDHPDVRLVVHFNMPANIDSLYQEMGRAGRDGLPSTCLMLYSGKDKGLQSFFIQSSKAGTEIKRSRWNTLNALVDYAEGSECRHAEILTYYQDSQRLKSCTHCDVCVPGSDRRISQPPPRLIKTIGTAISKVVKTRKKKQPQGEAPLTELEEFRFQDLRRWRKEKATELDVPAFVILSDRTLKDLAQKHPQSLSEIEDIHGFGEAKLERFGKEILGVLGPA